jgi:hypothetical protein
VDDLDGLGRDIDFARDTEEFEQHSDAMIV